MGNRARRTVVTNYSTPMSSPQVLPPQSMLKGVDVAVVAELSATTVCPITLYASEKAVSGYWYLDGSHVSKR
jgi:hypothetical protein